MKILYISPVDITAPKGASTHFLEVGQNLRKFGNTLLTICQGKKGKIKDFKIKHSPNLNSQYIAEIGEKKALRCVRKLFIKVRLAVIADFLFPLYLIYYLLAFKPDIVYYRGVTLGGIVSRIFKVPSVAEANGIYADEVEVKWPLFFKLTLSILTLKERINYSGATKVICVTEGIKRALVKRFGVDEERCKVIPNGVNTSLFRPLDKIACRKKLGLEQGYFYLGFVGMFRPWQGLDTLLLGMKIIKEMGHNKIRCLLAGDGDGVEILREMVKEYGLEEVIIFTGKIRYEEVPIYMNSFDVCLAPFKKERNEKIGLSPLKLYEYLACARPVIASKVRGVTEVIENGNCGFLIEPDNAQDLASKIVKSYNEQDNLVQLGSNGRTFVEKNSSWEKIARRVENVLKATVKETLWIYL